VLIFMALNIAVRVWLPSGAVLRLPWVIPALEAALLLVLVASSPDTPAEHRRLQRVAFVLVGLLVAAALWATAVLVADLIRGARLTDHADQLLATGAMVWLGNNLAFALLYWLMDGGGPHARLRRPVPVDFAFPQQLSPELQASWWRPRFPDYLYIGFTNATAFSPADVMPLTSRAKCAMLVHSTVSLALLALVVARAVGSFA
jgi:uncharacterized membrane protein